MPVRANHTASSRKSCSRRAESGRTLERYCAFAKLTVQSRIQFFADVLDCLSRWQLLPLCKVNQTNYTITLPNGSQFLFKGMQDPERIKSIKGLSDVVMEEASEFTLDDYTQLTLRLTPNTTRHVLPYTTVRTKTTASLTRTTSRRLKSLKTTRGRKTERRTSMSTDLSTVTTTALTPSDTLLSQSMATGLRKASACGIFFFRRCYSDKFIQTGKRTAGFST